MKELSYINTTRLRFLFNILGLRLFFTLSVYFSVSSINTFPSGVLNNLLILGLQLMGDATKGNAILEEGEL